MSKSNIEILNQQAYAELVNYLKKHRQRLEKDMFLATLKAIKYVICDNYSVDAACDVFYGFEHDFDDSGHLLHVPIKPDNIAVKAVSDWIKKLGS